ncbi:prepilin-type N-terminal cleavage/methylation domain-containing protein, partial [Klebsiella pneumoniae]
MRQRGFTLLEMMLIL